jgi:hypothetical protein
MTDHPTVAQGIGDVMAAIESGSLDDNYGTEDIEVFTTGWSVDRDYKRSGERITLELHLHHRNRGQSDG